MDEQKEYLTKEKFHELAQELDQLKKVKRKEIAENLEYAKQLGDLSENAEYHEARDLQASTEDRISKLETILKSAEIVSEHHTEVVEIGSVVTVEREKEKTPTTFTLVGSEETDIKSGKISIHSPLGECLIGKKKNDSFVCNAPGGTITGKIIEIK